MALLKIPSILVFFLSPCYLSVSSGWIARLHNEINPLELELETNLKNKNLDYMF